MKKATALIRPMVFSRKKHAQPKGASMIRLRVVYNDSLERPRTRSECVSAPRPCPYVSCRYHLMLDIQRNGRLRFNLPISPNEKDAESIADALTAMPETCALDVADRGGATFEEIGVMLSRTFQAIEQAEYAAATSVKRLNIDWDEPEHPEDPYMRYMYMDTGELEEAVTQLRITIEADDGKDED